jgi:phosphate transport system protein
MSHKNFAERLEELTDRLHTMSHDVEKMVQRAINLDESCDEAAVQEIRDADQAIDEAEVIVEETTIELLALHQPMATDLRVLVTVLKINNDLERIGDLAVNIAERSASLERALPFPVPEALRPMTEATAGMLRESLDAFVRADTRLARRVLAEDQVVDDFNRQIIVEMVERMKADSEQVDDALLILSASKNLERIADHATNIAEDVIFLVEGAVVRHTPD